MKYYTSRTRFHVGSRFFKALTVVFACCLLATVSQAQDGEAASTQHFKMLSTVEFDGQGQYRNQVETQFTVRRQPLEDDKVLYSLSSPQFDFVSGEAKKENEPALGAVSFVVDRATKQVSIEGEEFSFFEQLNNECVKSLKKVTKENVGKSWSQSFDLDFLESPFPKSLKLKLKAIPVQTDVMGDMIAVRAISSPFRSEAPKVEAPEEMGTIQSRIGTVYLFDTEIETIYMSISVFEARTKMNGSWEVLRHEVATYVTDESGEALDLTGLGKSFESLVKGLKMKAEGLEVVDAVPLPQWALSEGLQVSEMANICSSTACEGALNPVISRVLPVTRTVQFQSFGLLNSMGGLANAGGLGAGVPGVGGLNFAAAPGLLGAGALGGGLAGAGAVILASP